LFLQTQKEDINTHVRITVSADIFKFGYVFESIWI